MHDSQCSLSHSGFLPQSIMNACYSATQIKFGYSNYIERGKEEVNSTFHSPSLLLTRCSCYLRKISPAIKLTFLALIQFYLINCIKEGPQKENFSVDLFQIPTALMTSC